MRTLQQGMAGEDVRYLQYLLKISADGSFGPATKTAVINKQKSLGLTASGIVNVATQKAIGLYDFRVHIFDKKDYDIWFAGTPYRATVKPLKTLKTWAIEENADFTINLALFNMTGTGSDQYGVIKGRTVNTFLKGKGYDIGYGGVPERLTIDSNNIIGGALVGIKNGVAQRVSSIGATARNANGLLADGRYFHVQSVTVATEAAMVAFMMAHYKVNILLIQDGGGSTGFYDKSRDVLLAPKKEGTNGRAVASVACMRLKSVVPVGEPKVCPCCGQTIKE